jgi:hypothetical protein
MKTAVKNVTPTVAHGFSWAVASQLVVDPSNAAALAGMEQYTQFPGFLQAVGLLMGCWAAWDSVKGRRRLRNTPAPDA